MPFLLSASFIRVLEYAVGTLQKPPIGAFPIVPSVLAFHKRTVDTAGVENRPMQEPIDLILRLSICTSVGESTGDAGPSSPPEEG